MHRPSRENGHQHSPHFQFREELAIFLMDLQPPTLPTLPTIPIDQIPHQGRGQAKHGVVPSKMGIKAGYCAVCQAKGKRRHTYHMKRKALSELSGNSRRLHTPRTTFGCLICGVFICKEGRCWESHLAEMA